VRKRTVHWIAAAVAAAGLGFGSAPAMAEGANYVLATASTGGTYYPVGVALSTLVKVKLEPEAHITMEAVNSEGSGENIGLLRENKAQFAILQGLYGYFALTGAGPLAADGKQENLRSITMLWQNVEHFVVRKEAAKTGTIDDFVALKGERVAIGARNSGAIGSTAAILEGFGINAETDYQLLEDGYGPSTEALKNGAVKGVSTPAGAPIGAISQLLASAGDSVKLLNFTDEQMVKADGGRNLWTRYVIAPGVYPGQTEAVNTIAQPNFLAARADVPEEDAYKITKTIYENLPFLQAIHPATRAMAIEKAIAGLTLPLHPGAARYYAEVGVTIPERLIAK